MSNLGELVSLPDTDVDFYEFTQKLFDKVYRVTWSFNEYDGFWYIGVYDTVEERSEVGKSKVIKDKTILFRYSAFKLLVVGGKTIYNKENFKCSVVIHQIKPATTAIWERII